jgi:hypothetical protein
MSHYSVLKTYVYKNFLLIPHSEFHTPHLNTPTFLGMTPQVHHKK